MKPSLRSVDVEDSARSLSVVDELPPNQVMFNLPNASLEGHSVWGDIYRNKALRSVSNPP